jgi:hypothetical protein
LSAVLATTPWAFAILQWAGVLYLAWIGIEKIRDAGAPPVVNADDRSRGRFVRAILINSTNPKSFVFLGAFFPRFVVLDDPLLPQYGVLARSRPYRLIQQSCWVMRQWQLESVFFFKVRYTCGARNSCLACYSLRLQSVWLFLINLGSKHLTPSCVIRECNQLAGFESHPTLRNASRNPDTRHHQNTWVESDFKKVRVAEGG